jgi:hypothetical protein
MHNFSEKLCIYFGSFGDFMERKKINKIKRQKLVRVEAHN